MRTKEELKRQVRLLQKSGLEFRANPVVYQLLEIANNHIGTVDAYWTELEQGTSVHLNPNEERDEFVKTVGWVFEKKVNHACMLPEEQRKAAGIFRNFADYVARVNWGDRELFGQMFSEYGKTKQTMLSIIGEPEKRRSELWMRRIDYMQSKSIPIYGHPMLFAH